MTRPCNNLPLHPHHYKQDLSNEADNLFELLGETDPGSSKIRLRQIEDTPTKARLRPQAERIIFAPVGDEFYLTNTRLFQQTNF